MIKTYLMMVMAIVAAAFGVSAQVVTTDPTPLQEDSQNVVAYFHADRGNKGLINQPASAELYAHTGVCVMNANGETENWKYAPEWGDNDPKYKLEYVSENLWKLNIGDLRTYYGVKAGETITRLAFVFRNANKSKEGKGEGNSDIFVDVVDSGFQLALTSSLETNIVNGATGEVTFNIATTIAADLSLEVNGTVVGSSTASKALTCGYTFPAPGDYEVKAIATADGEQLTQSLFYCYAGNSKPAASSEVPAMGATRNADGTVTFCIAAPQKESALIVGSWNNYLVTEKQLMNYVDGPANGEGSFRYFTITLPDLPTTEPFMYYYIIDGISVGDPYAHMVLVPSEDKWINPTVFPGLPEYPEGLNEVPLAYFKDDFGAYDWKIKDFKGADKDNLVIYELLLRDFTGTEGKAYGDGTVRGAIEKIPYLKRLGINAVELLPIQEFNGNNSWGYNPNFYFAIDKAYGTPEDYKEFIDICHENGIAVILDVVFNQSDWLHPWYKLYPVGSNPFYNATAPHAYSVLNDWNQGYPLVRQQWYDMVKYWMKEYKVDGYRFDLVKGLGDNDSYPNPGDSGTNQYNASRVANMKAIHDAMREVNPDAYFINENLADAQEENDMAKDGEINWANYNNQGCQFAMGYSSGADLNGMWAPKSGRTPGSTVSYLESHDEERLAYKQNKWGAGVVKTDHAVQGQRLAGAAVQMLLVPGSHMIWEFSEMGNAESTKDNNGGNNTSPKVVNWSLLNDPVNGALVEAYAKLIGLRLEQKELFAEDANYSLNFNNWTARTVKSVAGNKELYVVINPSYSKEVTTDVEFNQKNDAAYKIYLQADGTQSTFSAAEGKVTVPANGFVVITTADIPVSGIEEIGEAAKDFVVSGANGMLNVYNVSAPVEVWNAAGVKVAAAAADFTMEVPTGVFFVRSGARTVKALVR